MAGFSVLRIILLSSVAFSLAGCLTNTKPNSSSNNRPENIGANNTRATPVTNTQATNNVSKPGLSPMELRLLAQAEKAFRDARYTTPSHDNAYDKFKSVLLINPKNQQARAGLQAILLRYAHLIRNAISDRRLASARKFWRQAKAYYPENKLLADLNIQINQARDTLLAKSRPSNGPVKSNKPAKKAWVEEVSLSPAGLKAKSDDVLAILSEIAMRLKASDESVHIFARSDREGRWIYKQLKKAADGYRIRGDIRIARTPKLRILPPL